MRDQEFHPFATLLRQFRETAGLTQEALAERAGLTAQAIGALETGKRRRPYPHTVSALADALGLSVEERAAFVAAASRFQPSTEQTSPPHHSPLPFLPVPPTPLIGREPEMAALEVLLRGSARLVTLTGAGGTGKTRLALEVAADLAGSFPDGVAFISLAPLADATLVIPTIAHTLGLRPQHEGAVREVLASFLRGRRLLLVLDNFEHLLAAAADIAELMAACRETTFLVTSRSPLRIRGEHEYPVLPLALPDSDGVNVDDVSTTGAVRLLIERARAVSPGFMMTESNAAAVIGICRRLDGLPLAIELAAARLKVVSPATLLARLDPALPILTGGGRDLPERQRTIRATIAWSYDLAEERDRTLFCRLAVFDGGASTEVVEAIAADLHLDESGPLGALARLVDQSLVTAERTADDEMRYRLLEPVREFAHERLAQSGAGDQVRDRHACLFLSFAESAEPELRGRQAARWLRALEAEHDNFRTALDWFLRRKEVESAVRLAWALWVFWWSRGFQAEGNRWLELILASRDALSRGAEARALLLSGLLHFRLGDHHRPAALLEEALPRLREEGDAGNIALAVGVLGLTRVRGGETALGEHLMAESVRLYQEAGDDWGSGLMLTYLGLVPFYRGEYEAALKRFEEGLALARAIGNPQLLIIALYDVGLARQALGDTERAGEFYLEALRIAVDLKDSPYEAYLLEGLAGVAGAEGNPVRAARLYGASRSRLATIGVPLYARATDAVFLERCLEQARSKADETAWTVAWQEGAAMAPSDALALALEGHNSR